MFIKNKYSVWYTNIIKKAKDRPDLSVYTEKHHILPKSLGGLDEKSNLVKLTAKEHFIVHHLLTKFTTNSYKQKMNYAFYCMAYLSNRRTSTRLNVKITSKVYENLKLEYIKSMTDLSRKRGNYYKLINLAINGNLDDRPLSTHAYYSAFRKYINTDKFFRQIIKNHKPEWLIPIKIPGKPKNIPKNLEGIKFGKLTVIKLSHHKRVYHWLCQCDCGNKKIIAENNLFDRRSSTKSCGCLKTSEHLVKKNKKNAQDKEVSLIKYAHMLANNEVIPEFIDGYTPKQLNSFRRGAYISDKAKQTIIEIYPSWKYNKTYLTLIDFIKNPLITRKADVIKGLFKSTFYTRCRTDPSFRELVFKYKPHWIPISK